MHGVPGARPGAAAVIALALALTLARATDDANLRCYVLSQSAAENFADRAANGPVTPRLLAYAEAFAKLEQATAPAVEALLRRRGLRGAPADALLMQTADAVWSDPDGGAGKARACFAAFGMSVPALRD